ncbi:amidohydrolase family protein [Kribbella albertanoniae]|nr:amidohydrolase family protein [Kribbella albertanoniae]
MGYSRRQMLGIVPVAAVSAAWPGVAAAVRPDGGAVLIRDVRIFDGRRMLDGRRSVLIRDGVIAAIGDRGLVGDGMKVVDGRGGTLLPGLIESHVHTFEGSSADALRFGVTTELEMFGEPGQLAVAKQRRRSRKRVTAADLWSAGNGVTVPGGHPVNPGYEFPRVLPETDLDRFVADRLQEGSDYLKFVYEPGDPPDRPLPSLSLEQVTATIRAAHRRGRLAVGHVEKLKLYVEAVLAGADGIVHVPYNAVASAAEVETIRQTGSFAVPTLSVVDWGLGAKSLLADDRITPWLSPTQQYLLSQEPPDRPGRPDFLGIASANVRRFHAAGIPVLAGADAPVRANVSGASLFTELEHLVRAGLTPAEALTAATAAPARHFRLTDRGRITPGRRADLVLTTDDPTQDITNLRTLHTIWKNGHQVDRTPPPEEES